MTTETNIEVIMKDIGKKAKEAKVKVSKVPEEVKNKVLINIASRIISEKSEILAANDIDVKNAISEGVSGAKIDRLTLDDKRIKSMSDSLLKIAGMPDPVSEVTAEWTVPSGLNIKRVRMPLGVIGVIYESRPNVTLDASALCFKSGNAVILRGGSDSLNSSLAIHNCFVAELENANLPKEAVQKVNTKERAAVDWMLSGLDGAIDIIVPRGGKGLVEQVNKKARVPVFAHLEGVCHIYIDKNADIEMAVKVVTNAKMRRTGICGAAECILIDRACIRSHLTPVIDALSQAGCEIRGDPETQINSSVVPAKDDDWGKEFLDAIIAIKSVDGVHGAVEHISKYSSEHTDAIITEDASTAGYFFDNVESAIVMHNASTQFADGGEFGMGAEIGIATGRIHARGPIGLEQLTSYQYHVVGKGNIRPL